MACECIVGLLVSLVHQLFFELHCNKSLNFYLLHEFLCNTGVKKYDVWFKTTKPWFIFLICLLAFLPPLIFLDLPIILVAMAKMSFALTWK